MICSLVCGEGNGSPLHYSHLENLMDQGACWAAVHGVAKSQTWLSNFTFTFHFHALEKEIVTHSSVLAWRIPGTGEPGGLPSMGSHRVGHNWSDLAAAAIGVSRVLKSPTIIVLLSISPIKSLVFVLCTEVLLCWVHRYSQLLCLPLGLMPWSLCSVLPSLL